MSGSGLKRKAGLEDESDGLIAKDNNAKRIKAKEKKKRLSRLEEYDEDEGRESSRNFQRWAEIFESNTKGEAIKSKTFVKNFEAKAKKQRDQVRDYMQYQEKKLTESKDQFVGKFEGLYSAMTLPSGKSNVPGNKRRRSGKEGHVLFKEAQAVISGGYSLLNKFKETDELLKNYKIEFPTAKWKQDAQDMKELLACGREHGEKLVEEKLAPGAYPSPQYDRYKANEKDNMALELFKDSHKASDGDSWGTIAAEQVKKLTALVKTVPIKGSERGRN